MQGRTQLHLAVEYADDEAAELLKLSADPNAQNVKSFRLFQDALEDADDIRLPRVYQHPYRPLLHVALKVPGSFGWASKTTTFDAASSVV